jgi:hypothetical protein
MGPRQGRSGRAGAGRRGSGTRTPAGVILAAAVAKVRPLRDEEKERVVELYA